MNSFLNPNNGTSLTGVTDLTAHRISLFPENEAPQNIKDTFMNTSLISIAEPYDAQIDELGNNIMQMYQFIGDINDTKVAGLESLLNIMNENFFSKNEPAVNEHPYHTFKTQYNEDIHNIYNIGKSKSYKINNHSFHDTRHYSKKQFITNHLTNNITRNNIITNTESVVTIKTYLSTKHYITNVFRSSNDYIEYN